MLLFGASLGLFFYTRRKGTKRNQANQGPDEQDKSSDAAQAHEEPVSYAELSMSPKYEMSGDGRGFAGVGYSELASTTETQELDGRHVFYELDSGDAVSRSSGKR